MFLAKFHISLDENEKIRWTRDIKSNEKLSSAWMNDFILTQKFKKHNQKPKQKSQCPKRGWAKSHVHNPTPFSLSLNSYIISENSQMHYYYKNNYPQFIYHAAY